MNTYHIPIFFEPFEKQKKAARLLHLLAGFLMIANAWGDYHNSTPHLFFIVVQVAAAIMIIAYAFAGKRMVLNQGWSNGMFRLVGAAVLLFASWHFFRENDMLRALLQFFGGAGLLLLFYTERKIYQPCQVKIDEEGVHTPNNLKERLIEWKNIDNMLIKNDFVSINTTQNQFIQYETAAVLGELQMDEMNAFCRERFTKAS